MMLPTFNFFKFIVYLMLSVILAALVGFAAFAWWLPAYDRGEWHPRWEDENRDCQDTRQEVLIEESVLPVILSEDGCKVLSGEWYDPYSGRFFTDPKKLDIDHLVPLKEAHLSGGTQWSKKKKRAYSNDLTYTLTLIAVSAKENRSKGAKDPARWLPSDEAYHCEYVNNWMLVKRFWGLGADQAEIDAIERIKKRACAPEEEEIDKFNK